MARKRTGVARLADGFYITASDLYRAVHAGNFLGSELLLIGAAHEAGWAPGLLDGSREPRPFRLNLSRLARVSVFHRDTLRVAHRRLEMYRVFVPHELEDGTHWINKRYDEWLDADGGPRFSPGHLEWIAEPGPTGVPIVGDSRVAARGSGPAAPHARCTTAPSGAARRCVITPPLPQVDAPATLDGAGTGDASARANSDFQKREKTTPLPPKGGEEEVPSRRGRKRRETGPDWEALAERDTDVEV